MSNVPSVYEATAVFNAADQLAIDAAEAVFETRSRVALGQAPESALTAALKVQGKADERRKTAAQGVELAKEAQRAADEAQRRQDEGIKVALRREAHAKLGKAQIATVALLTRHLAEMNALAAEYSDVEDVIGHTEGVFAPRFPMWRMAAASLAKIVELMGPVASRVDH